MPGLAVAAGVLGIVGVLPLAYVVLWVIAFSRLDGSLGPIDWVLVSTPVLELVGAVLLLCRRSWSFLAVACLPPIALLCFFLLVSASSLVGLLWPLACLVLPGLTLCFTLNRGVRDWVGDRTRYDPRQVPAPLG